MAANIKINVDNKQAVQKVNEVITKVNEAKAAAGQPLDIGKQGVDKIKQASKALDGFKRTAVSGIGKQLTSAFAGIGKALLSPLGAAVVLIQLIYKVGKSFYDQVKKVENLKLNNENRLRILKQENQQLEEEKKKSEDIAKTLAELNSHEKLNNVERQIAISLVDQLNKGYQGMNLQIDKTTGKVKNLNEEMAKLREQQKQQEIANITQQMSTLVKVIDAELNDIFTNSLQNFQSLMSDSFVYNLPTIRDEFMKNWDAVGIPWGETRQLYKHLDEIQNKLNAAGDDYIKRMEIVKKDILPLIADTEDKTRLGSLITGSNWKEMEELNKKLGNLKNTQLEINQAEKQYLKAQEAAAKSIGKQKDALVQLEKWKKKTERDREFNNSPAQKQVDMLRNQIAEADTKLAQLQDKRVAEAGYQFDLPWYQGQIKELEKKRKEAITPEYRESLEKQLAILYAKQKDAQAAMNQSEERERKIQEDILKTTQQRINKTNELADIQKKMTKAEQDFFNSQLKGIQSKVYEMNGKSADYQLKQMMERFKEQFKRDANSDEQAAMKGLINTSMQLNKMQNNIPIPIESTITNELARKGGFASSVVVEDANSLNKRILEANEKQVSINEKMLTKVDKLDSTIKQLGIIR